MKLNKFVSKLPRALVLACALVSLKIQKNNFNSPFNFFPSKIVKSNSQSKTKCFVSKLFLSLNYVHCAITFIVELTSSQFCFFVLFQYLDTFYHKGVVNMAFRINKKLWEKKSHSALGFGELESFETNVFFNMA